MSTIDLIIVYFAVGAPFATYRLARFRGHPRRMISTLSVSWLLWPWKAADAVWRNLNTDARNAATTRRAQEIASQIESIAFGSQAYIEVTGFRDRFEAYAALAIAHRQTITRSPVADLLEIAGNTDPRISAHCLVRKQRSVIEHHLDTARHEFLEVIRGSLGTATHARRLTPLLLELSDEIDPQLETDTLDLLPDQTPDLIQPAMPSVAGSKR